MNRRSPSEALLSGHADDVWIAPRPGAWLAGTLQLRRLSGARQRSVLLMIAGANRDGRQIAGQPSTETISDV